MSSLRWVPWAIAGGLSVVVAVNGALAYFAVTTSTGLVTEHPFENGNDYNRELDAAAAQDKLGWHGGLRVMTNDAGVSTVAADLTDRAGNPLNAAAVTARIIRPIEPVPDIVVALAQVGSGRYANTVALGRRGQWDVHIAARRGADVFQFSQRVVIK